MKRIITFLLVCLIGLTAYSQEHLKFKGIEIDGKIEQMAKKLEAAGFECTSPDKSSFKGVFAGREASISVFTNMVDNVYRIAVSYDMSNTPWRAIKTEMVVFEENLTKKYGAPTSAIYEFDRHYADGSGREINGFMMERNHWSTNWEIETGNIGIMFAQGKMTPPMIIIYYQDKLNYQVQEEQIYDDL